MRLKDKVAIITGGSRGIGFATAERFLQEGAKVIITASSEENAKKSAARLKELYPDSVVDGISPNLSSLESVRKEFKKVTEKYGCVDILVNNAGVSESTPFTEYTEETYDRVMDLNVTYLLEADPELPLRIKEDENSEIGWIGVEEIERRSTEKWFVERIYSKLCKKAQSLRNGKLAILE